MDITVAMRSVLLGLTVGLLYAHVFMKQQASSLVAKPSYFFGILQVVLRYMGIFLVMYLVMYTHLFAIWWVMGGFLLMFWIYVIQRLRVG